MRAQEGRDPTLPDMYRSPAAKRPDVVIPSGSPMPDTTPRQRPLDEVEELRAAYEDEMLALEDENRALREELMKTRDELQLYKRSSNREAIIQMQQARIDELTQERDDMQEEKSSSERRMRSEIAEVNRLKSQISESPKPPVTPQKSPTLQRAQTPQPIFGKRPPPRNHPALRESIVFEDVADEEERREEDESVNAMSPSELANVIKTLEEQKMFLERKINKVIPRVHNIETLQIKLERENNERQYDSVCRMLAKARLQLVREKVDYP